MTTDTIVKSTTKTKTNVKPPQMYKVIYLNDDRTTYDFVIDTLMEIFGKSFDEALTLAHTVNEEDAAVVAVLPHEIAETKAVEVTSLARKNGFPLQIKIEPESD
jgi:ATP-dependent Clp protease adaptor protein ClpS